MAARSNWKGYLRLSLVSCAVALYPAVTASSRLKCHTINRRTGNRIKEEVVDAVTEEPVEREDRVKGCEAGVKGEFIPVEEDDLKAIRLESDHTINIESFVDRAEVDERYLEKPYYLAPEDRVSREAFAVIRDAMRGKNVAGLGRLVIYRRERVVLLEPFRDGMLATLLRYDDEVRSPTAVFEEIGAFDAPPDMRRLAEELITRSTGRFDPARFEDRYEQALTALVHAKAEKGRAKSGKPAKGAAKGEEVSAPAPASNVVSLMDALRRSIDSEREGGAKAAHKPAPAADRGSKGARPAERAKAAKPTPATAAKTSPRGRGAALRKAG